MYILAPLKVIAAALNSATDVTQGTDLLVLIVPSNLIGNQTQEAVKRGGREGGPAASIPWRQM